jgi:hypothetical protein
VSARNERWLKKSALATLVLRMMTAFQDFVVTTVKLLAFVTAKILLSHGAAVAAPQAPNRLAATVRCFVAQQAMKMADRASARRVRPAATRPANARELARNAQAKRTVARALSAIPALASWWPVRRWVRNAAEKPGSAVTASFATPTPASKRVARIPGRNVPAMTTAAPVLPAWKAAFAPA